jgi:hypothetical protein
MAITTVIPQNFLFGSHSEMKENLCGIRFVFLRKNQTGFRIFTLGLKEASGLCGMTACL